MRCGVEADWPLAVAWPLVVAR